MIKFSQILNEDLDAYYALSDAKKAAEKDGKVWKDLKYGEKGVYLSAAMKAKGYTKSGNTWTKG